MAHPAVAQAAVIAIPTRSGTKGLWPPSSSRGRERHEEELQKHLENDFAKFWLPDAYEFVESIPMTATGKFQKLKLREQFEGYQPTTS
jgi:fatty-acyl-CoA synthase